MNIDRVQLFIKEGLSPQDAKVAAEASYLEPKDRTPEQKEAIHLISEKIAENNRAFAYKDGG